VEPRRTLSGDELEDVVQALAGGGVAVGLGGVVPAGVAVLVGGIVVAVLVGGIVVGVAVGDCVPPLSNMAPVA
jgi:hypothetical protein